MNKDSFSKNFIRLERLVNKLLNSQYLTHGMGRSLRKLSKEITLYKNHLRGSQKWQGKKKISDITKIQIGGGRHYLKGFLNIDIVPPADLICDVRESLPLEDRCCEFIFSEHFLEHIDYPTSVKKFIKECYRVLKPGGQLVIGAPDSELAVKNYIKRDFKYYKKMIKTWYAKRNCLAHFNTYIDLVNYHFRDQDDDKEYTSHLWAYDYEKLESLLRGAGFTKMRKWKFDKSIANPKRKWGSFYIVARK